MDLPLPSSRELAQQLQVSRNTIVLAYQRLVDEGYLISRERQGYFVNPALLKSKPLYQEKQRTTDSGTPNWQPRLNTDLSVQRNIHNRLIGKNITIHSYMVSRTLLYFP